MWFPATIQHMASPLSSALLRGVWGEKCEWRQGAPERDVAGVSSEQGMRTGGYPVVPFPPLQSRSSGV